MTQEEKELLLKDLCARLPYGVICCVAHKKNGSLVKEDMKLSGTFEDGNFYFLNKMGSTYSDNYIPYLRSMSTMTEEEKDFIRNNYFFEDWNSWNDLLHLHYHEINIEEISEFMDWLYAHHFDFPRKINGKLTTLADLGLAIEAPNNMYNVKKQ